MVYFKLFVSTVFLVSGFIVFLSYRRLKSLYEFAELVSINNRTRIERRLCAHRILMIVFTLGYTCMAFLYYFKAEYLLESLVVLICFLSSVFIYTSVKFQTYIREELLRTIRGIIPICMNCKKVRCEGDGSRMKDWITIERYIFSKTDAEFSHGLCPECYNDLKNEFSRSQILDN